MATPSTKPLFRDFQKLQSQDRLKTLFGKGEKPLPSNPYAKQADVEARQSELLSQIEELRAELSSIKKTTSASLGAIKVATIQRQLNIPVTVDQGGTGRSDNNEFYIGGNPDADGTWKFVISGNDLSVQRRESGSWVEKSAFLA